MKRITVFATIAAFCLNVADAAQSFIPGKVKEEYWQGSGAGPFKADVEAGTAGTPTSVSLLDSFEVPLNIANNYTVRVSGVFIPAATGDYVFIISADDTADLYLSTDATPANKRVIAQQPGWNSNRQWVSDAGGGVDLQQKTSNTWTNGVGATPYSAGIHLLAGTQYYIEGVMNEFGGGDNLAVTFYNSATESPPSDGDAPRLTGSVIGVNVTSATTLTFTTQPQNATAFAGTLAQFSVAVQTDSEIAPTYQWRKGGAIITNATAAAYSLIAATADNAAQFDCVVVVPGLTNTSSAATLTVQAGAITINGKLKDEFYSGQTRAAVESGGGGKPTFVNEFTSFLAPVNFAENFTRRVSGYFTPAASGNFVFFVCSDDDSDLFLSTDDNPANKRLIAQEQNWSGNLSWVSSGGGSSLSQKRSDQWSPDGGTTTPYSAGIPLVAGTKYYIEGVAHEGGGGDNFAATFKLLADPDPADATAPLLTGAVISYITGPVSTGTITNQPQNVTVYESGSISLSVGVQTDSEVTPLYQWRKGGGNVAGATAATFTIPYAVTADAGSYDCVVTIPNFTTTLTSSAATVTVQSAPFVAGYLKYEYFPGSDRPAVENNTAGSPSFAGNTIGSDKSGGIRIFETGINFADNYANRISGLFLPPATGDYVFFVTGDDDCDLFLSTDDRPANKRMIAQEASWSNSRAWNTAGGGTSTAAQKRSDQFSPDGGTTFPFATGIHLVAGQRYYLEGVHHEGGGGDDFGATYIVYGAADPTDGDAPALTGNVVGVLVPPQSVTITQQPPASVTAPAATTATFTVAATTTGFYPPSYQWKKGGVDIAGATGASYTTPVLSVAADNNSQYLCAISILGTNPTNSQTVTLTVTQDVTPPTVVEAGGSVQSVSVTFSELMDAATAGSAGSYNIPGVTVSSAIVTDIVVGSYAVSVAKLAISGAVAGNNYTLTISGAKDKALNTVAANTTVPFTAYSAYYDFNDGQLPAGTGVGGPTAVLATGGLNGSGMLQLTPKANGLQGGFAIPDPVNGATVTNMTANFKLFIGKGSGNAADGFSFNFASDLSGVTSTGEEGSGSGITVSFDTYDNGSSEAPAISIKVGGVEFAKTNVSKATLVNDRLVDVTIRLNSNGTLDVIHDGTTYFDKVDLVAQGYVPITGGTFLLGARTGGENEEHDVDNLGILENATATIVTQPKFAPPTLTGGNLRLSWTGTGTLQQTDSLTSPSWTSAPSQANPQTVPATTGNRYYRIAP